MPPDHLYARPPQPLPTSRKVLRVIVEPAPPAGWSDLGDGTWSWVSSGQSVTCSIFVRADGTVSAPQVLGVGKMWFVVTEMKRALTAVEALLDYLPARQVPAARLAAGTGL
jgi:hypothetical protein